jgi:hypothetical protein
MRKHQVRAFSAPDDKAPALRQADPAALFFLPSLLAELEGEHAASILIIADGKAVSAVNYGPCNLAGIPIKTVFALVIQDGPASADFAENAVRPRDNAHGIVYLNVILRGTLRPVKRSSSKEKNRLSEGIQVHYTGLSPLEI